MTLVAPTQRDIVRRIQMRLLGDPVAVTDLTLISTLRILIEQMYGPEFFLLWAGLVRAQTEWFIQSATGDNLRRRLRDFNMPDLPGPSAAYGPVEVTTDAATNIPVGTILRTDPTDPSARKQYRVVSNPAPEESLGEGDGSWRVDGTRAIDVMAVEAGASGNVAAGLITAAETSVAHFVSCANPGPILNGRDAPTDADVRQLWYDYLASLTRGTRPALAAGLRRFVGPDGRRVHSAAFEEWGGSTLLAGETPVALKIYVDEGASLGGYGQALATPGLVNAIQRWVDGSDTDADSGWRADGVPTAVVPAMGFPVAVAATLDVDARYPVSAVVSNARNAILGFFAELPVAGIDRAGALQGQFSLARLFRSIEDVAGVLRTTLETPRSDIAVPVGFKAVGYTGGITVTGQVVR